MADNTGEELTSTENIGIISRYEKYFIIVGKE